MDADSITQALQSRGWQASTVRRSDVPDLVEVNDEGLFKCVDGRPSSHPDAMRGPKALGGVYAVATARGVRDLAGLQRVVRELADAGYVPSVHGDDHADPPAMGCGFFKLWVTGQLDGLEAPEFDAEQGREAVIEAGGVFEQLVGEHRESVVMINLVPGTTLEPATDQRFVVDAWAATELDLDVPTYLTRAAETVEKLGGAKVARIITE